MARILTVNVHSSAHFEVKLLSTAMTTVKNQLRLTWKFIHRLADLPRGKVSVLSKYFSIFTQVAKSAFLFSFCIGIKQKCSAHKITIHPTCPNTS